MFLANKAGRLLELIRILHSRQVHVVALTILDTTDSSIVRMVVDDPDQARAIFHEQAVAHTESTVVAVELAAATELPKVFSSLLEAEINILTTYAFLVRPEAKPALCLNLDDNELGGQVLSRGGFQLLGQGDISR
ncbi:MAG: acetolactate synthase [Verrucomicrobia bacterium]|nr:acetolactate synthase [Verrucomicrobiota bacterium]